MTKKGLMIKAHKMTKEIKNEFPEVDYKFQLGLCISYLQEQAKNESKAKFNIHTDVYDYLTDTELNTFITNLDIESLNLDDFTFIEHNDCDLCLFKWVNIYNEIIVNISIL